VIPQIVPPRGELDNELEKVWVDSLGDILLSLASVVVRGAPDDNLIWSRVVGDSALLAPGAAALALVAPPTPATGACWYSLPYKARMIVYYRINRATRPTYLTQCLFLRCFLSTCFFVSFNLGTNSCLRLSIINFIYAPLSMYFKDVKALLAYLVSFAGPPSRPL
jgi:hypothetical protein